SALADRQCDVVRGRLQLAGDVAHGGASADRLIGYRGGVAGCSLGGERRLVVHGVRVAFSLGRRRVDERLGFNRQLRVRTVAADREVRRQSVLRLRERLIDRAVVLGEFAQVDRAGDRLNGGALRGDAAGHLDGAARLGEGWAGREGRGGDDEGGNGLFHLEYSIRPQASVDEHEIRGPPRANHLARGQNAANLRRYRVCPRV